MVRIPGPTVEYSGFDTAEHFTDRVSYMDIELVEEL